MKVIFKLIIGVLFVFVIKSCQSQNTNNKPLERQWMLISFQDFSKDFLMNNKAEMNLTNSTAFMGCNRMFFQADIKNRGTIQFSNIGGTLMFCDGNQNLETEFGKWLPKMNNYKIEGHFLTLSDGKGHEMKFVASDWD